MKVEVSEEDLLEGGDQPEEEEEEDELDRSFPKADVVHRFIAKFLDLLIAAGLAKFLFPVGFMTGLTYLLIADGFSNGQSLGKRLIGLQTMVPKAHIPATYRESILRNIPCGAAYLFFLIPWVGWILGTGILVFEALLIIGNKSGVRIGDEIAGTRVIGGISTGDSEPVKTGEPLNA
ncbi:MAG TPA: RDD family protein [Nitrospiria bacterium]